MPLSWNEIKDRALRFSREWAGEASERAEAQTFWNAFFDVFGLTRRRVASFEEPVKRLRDGGKTTTGKIDLFWKGVLLVEHKSQGKDLARAYTQAVDYFEGIAERDLPRYVLVSDFARFRLHDLDSGAEHDFDLKDLHRKVRLFGFIAGYQTRIYKDDDPVNVAAAEKMGALHDALEASGYDGHPLEVLLVRLLFCLFADDTGIFDRNAFRELVELRTAVDGSDLGRLLNELFEVLNTPAEKRQRALDEQLVAFPYVNGRLFEERLFTAAFDARTRSSLLDACALDWGQISPAIFGAMFQSVMDPKLRRNLGAHYTSEKNIQKLIGPLFLDELKADLARIRALKQTNVRQAQLRQFHQRLASLRFLDPACGCGNFLVVTYRELRALELEVLRELHADVTTRFLSVKDEIHVDVDQFYGIEIEEFPAQIAQVALWLVDHQMNQKVSEEFGELFVRLPLVKSPNIVHGVSALAVDWNSVCPKERLSYILGNPPFSGAKVMSDAQRAEIVSLFPASTGAGVLDFVTGWYAIAVRFMQGTRIKTAFVSTNSITQGEQPGILWPELWKHGAHIHFAHRTFQWSNEARGVAAVHCVIVGLAAEPTETPLIYEYESLRSDPHVVPARNINPYLVDAPNIVLPRRDLPLCAFAPEIGIGNKPIDDGAYLFSVDEATEFLKTEPGARRFMREWLGADEFLNGWRRYCLWLGDAEPSVLSTMPRVLERIDHVRRFRSQSRSEGTRRLSATPTRFHVENIPSRQYLAIPEVSSERRKFIPMGFLSPDVLCSNLMKVAPQATIGDFGILQSTMHMAWVRATCGRLKSDFRYSKDIVYNNFPWPDAPTDATKAAIEATAHAVLDARAQFPGSSLADLYDPRTMPPVLVKAHQALDRAVDAAYLAGEAAAGRRKPSLKTDAERVAFLFSLYQHYTSLLPAPAAKPKRPRKPRTMVESTDG
ncbi:MAG: hypothetical protein LW860_02060 [Xanthomonadaceae bacterium]|jgi:hypothetical protein|nr:hypothetical protein [Xanthomonadaceae bacterium]